MPVQLSSVATDDRPGAYPGLDLLATAVLLLDANLEVCYANPAADKPMVLTKVGFVPIEANVLANEPI